MGGQFQLVALMGIDRQGPHPVLLGKDGAEAVCRKDLRVFDG